MNHIKSVTYVPRIMCYLSPRSLIWFVSSFSNKSSRFWIIRYPSLGAWQVASAKGSIKGLIVGPLHKREIESSVVADWTTEIRRAIDFFYSTYPDDQIQKIVLSGGGANIKEFRKLLAVQTSTEVSVINPFEKFNTDNEKLDEAYLNSMGPQAAICMGLAIRRVDDK